MPVHLEVEGVFERERGQDAAGRLGQAAGYLRQTLETRPQFLTPRELIGWRAEEVTSQVEVIPSRTAPGEWIEGGWQGYLRRETRCGSE
jgi:hypothetical protein